MSTRSQPIARESACRSSSTEYSLQNPLVRVAVESTEDFRASCHKSLVSTATTTLTFFHTTWLTVHTIITNTARSGELILWIMWIKHTINDWRNTPEIYVGIWTDGHVGLAWDILDQTRLMKDWNRGASGVNWLAYCNTMIWGCYHSLV